ncbi:MAG: type II toxin-antitoxin system Phd/YefM family antitoxin [Gammaproteobacteria bacterium]
MKTISVSLTDAKSRLGELVERAASGEDIMIMRRGWPIARLTEASPEPKPVDLDVLKKLTGGMPRQPECGRRFIRQLREATRY